MHRTLAHARLSLAAVLACAASHGAATAAPASSGTSSAASAPSAAQAALGPTVAYNEAVRVVGGKRVVQLPPPSKYTPPGWSVTKPGNHYGGSSPYMVETVDGLMQCTVPFYHPVGCEPSTYGTQRKLRTWIVLREGQWEGCIGIDQPKRCRAVHPKGKRISGVMPFEDA